LQARSSACIAGVISSRRERPPGCLAEAGRSGCVGRPRCQSAGWASARPLRGLSAPPRGVGRPGAAVSLFRAARGLCGARLRRGAAGPTPCPPRWAGVPSPPRRVRGAASPGRGPKPVGGRGRVLSRAVAASRAGG
jgi:hypothetical protein